MAEREPTQRNNAASWSDFDAGEYWKNNYAFVLPEDAQIIRQASDFLIKACGGRPPISSALDVGAGTNLYPALLMLPWTEHIVFTEYAPDNIAWLAQNLADGPGEWTWQPFWDLVAGRSGYADVRQPRRRLAARHEIRHVSIFDLTPRAWDLGSMFFVADGMTSDEAEFEAGVHAFLGALTPGAPFMMAFMEGSAGYDVSGVRFPGVTVTPASLAALLARLPVAGTQVLRTDKTTRPLRIGYEAMLLVTGFVAAGPLGGFGRR
jgi:hypothetical protein